jgi:hypothetical protein
MSFHFNDGLSEAHKSVRYSFDARPPMCNRSQMRQGSCWLAKTIGATKGGFPDEVSQGLPVQLCRQARSFFDRTG